MANATNDLNVSLLYMGNLTALRGLLIKNRESVKLDMKLYQSTCDSSGCAIGHAFHFGIGDTEEYLQDAVNLVGKYDPHHFHDMTDYNFRIIKHIDYSAYSNEYLMDILSHVCVKDEHTDTEYHIQAWAFLFSAKNCNDFDDLIHRLDLVINGDKDAMLAYLLRNIGVKYRKLYHRNSNIRTLSVKAHDFVNTGRAVKPSIELGNV